MKQIVLVAILSFCLVITGAAQNEFAWVRIAVPDRATLGRIWSAGVDFEGSSGKIGGVMEFITNETDRLSLGKAGIQFTIIQKEALGTSEYATGPANALGFGDGSLAGFYTFNEVRQQLDSMKYVYPNLITAQQSIATTYEGRPIIAVKISRNADVDNPLKPEVLFTGMHHAREPEGMMTLMYYMWWLLQNYGTDPRATYLLDNRQIWFIPVVNPDGYINNEQYFTTYHSFGYWRKNKRDNNGNGIFDSNDGVDLNRNYGPTYMWNASGGGSSTVPGSETYRGPSAFSEPEVAGIRDFVYSHNFRTCLNYHTYGNDIIYPWGYILQETEDSLTFREFGFDLATDNRYTTGTDLQTVGYTTRGNSDDFMYGGTPQKIYAMTPEVGTSGFWPPTAEILPLAEENLTANLFLSFVSGQYTVVKDHLLTNSIGQESLGAGDAFRFEVTLRNKGLADAANMLVSCTSENGDLLFSPPSVHLGSITARSDSAVIFTGTIAPAPQFDVPVRVFVTLTDSSGYYYADTLTVFVGNPDILLNDPADAGMTNWVATGTWGTTSAAHTPPLAFTDSPSGNYTYSTDASLTLKSPLFLFGYTGCVLSFWTKWDITSTVDFATVEVSTDGGSGWTSVRSTLSRKGSGFGTQGADVWGYDGYPPGLGWVRQYVDLSSLVNKQVLIRFRLQTYNTGRDGIYIDDIRVLGFGNRYHRVALTFTDNMPQSDELFFGENSFATAGIDSTLGETVLPPKPVPGVFDIRWVIPPTNGTMTDIRPTLSSENPSNIFIAEFQPGPAGYPVTIRWNPSDFRPGSWRLRDGLTGGSYLDVNMWVDTSAVINSDSVTSIEIVHGQTDTTLVRMIPGWQMVTMPVIKQDGLLAHNFPGTVSRAFAYQGRYTPRDTLEPMNGYWVKYPDVDSLRFTGIPIVLDTLNLPSGWSLLGGTSFTSPVDSWNCTPSPCRPYVYRNGYVQISEIQPGEGFWMKGPQTVIISCIPRAASMGATARQNVTKGLRNTLSFHDATKGAATLILPGQQADKAEQQEGEIPPVPPEGAFDVRFVSNTMTAQLPATPEAPVRILLQTASYPVILDWDFTGTDMAMYEIVEQKGDLEGNYHPMSEKGGFIITDPDVKALTIRRSIASLRPKEFALGQNYPNPFNPATTIAFELPDPSVVTLEVMNLLGQRVRTLYSGSSLEAGRYKVRFDGQALSSGFYIYRLTAVSADLRSSVTLQKTMALIK